MRYSFTGKNITVSDSLKEKTIQKLGRLEKLLPENPEVIVKFSIIKLDHKVEVTIPLHKRVLRAEVTKEDLHTALDEIVDILEKQMIKYTGRLRSRSRKEPKYKEELNMTYSNDDNHEDTIVIEKSKRFAIKPMDAEEAVMEMELLGHSFYVFRNYNTEEVNVVYKRKTGTYGLIEPEL